MMDYLRLTYFSIWLLLAISVLIIIFWIIKDSKKGNPEKLAKFLSKNRRWAFIAIVIVLILSFSISLIYYPYPQFKPKPVLYVSVVAERYAWYMNTTKIPSNVPVAFLVTSRDVNHDFGIYDEKGDLIAQVQAMPGYINELILTLKPGNYSVVCLEFCGPYHFAMLSSFEVIT
ncbi:MAG TPA: hypothetical protein VKU94_05810 [Geobacterales bacterium]|nr:hypothetical protein [Geobacterales bacterium]